MDHKSSVLSPFSFAYEVVSKAFEGRGRPEKRLQRAIKSVLNLAASRGYSQSSDFLSHFIASSRSLDISDKLIRRLFAFVSISEFLQVTQPAYQLVRVQSHQR